MKDVLEFAYKACRSSGMNVSRHEWESIDPFSEGVDYLLDDQWWTPLEDDGDAFKLAINLKINFGYNIQQDHYEAVSFNRTHRFGAADKCPRMAILMCAAEMGKYT
jgi:hypothetical protein